MTYQSIVTVLTDSALDTSVLPQAADLASQMQAHLEVLCLGVDSSQSGYYFAGANAVILQEALTRASAEAQALDAAARVWLGRADLRWSTDVAMAQASDLGRLVAGHARFADLVVLSKPYGAGCGIDQEAVIEGALFGAQVPVLVMPEGLMPRAAPRRVVIGWNESAEALRAVRAALPLLKTADRVAVTVIDPPVHGPTRSDPGGPLSQYLARHGVKVEIDILSRSLPRVSEVLARYCTDADADMLVMGAYGHSRFREAILGGATRDLLEHARLPVFMAH
ncbi:universal stress protein [Marinovum sp.]|uniref:universal stress protein n=1 Tax=Marinovum sp. TaxID=2024839 RepID=UPI002B2788BF|nr:universal stress protein [Marinovum sp.]